MGRKAVAMLATVVVVVVLGACGDGEGSAERTIDWNETSPLAGHVVDGQVVLSTTGGTLPLTVIEDPGIGGTGYAVRGDVSYENVSGTGYLEMWSYFADGGAFFSRTLDTQGPMAALSGSATDRAFELPLFLNGAVPPERLEINVVLPQGGSATLGPLSLVSLDDTGAWWDDSTAGVIGAGLGATIGLLGAVTGILAGTGRARRFVLASFVVALGLGVAMLAVGLVALAGGQPYAVYYPLLLGGGIVTFAFGLALPSVRKRYQDRELRRIRAFDAR